MYGSTMSTVLGFFALWKAHHAEGQTLKTYVRQRERVSLSIRVRSRPRESMEQTLAWPMGRWWQNDSTISPNHTLGHQLAMAVTGDAIYDVSEVAITKLSPCLLRGRDGVFLCLLSEWYSQRKLNKISCGGRWWNNHLFSFAFRCVLDRWSFVGEEIFQPRFWQNGTR